MELIVYILYQFASHSILVLVPLIFLVIGAFTLSAAVIRSGRSAKRRLENDYPTVGKRIFRAILLSTSLVAALVSVLIAGFALLNIIKPHIVDGALIYKYGERAEGKVLSRERTNNRFNEEPVDRYNVIYRTASGENIETYFESWDFNIYPSANSVRYPTTGQTFSVAYLPQFPRAYIILTDESSEYTSSVECGEILRKILEKKNKFEFEPKNVKYMGEYMEALSQGIENKCGDQLFDELRRIGETVKQK